MAPESATYKRPESVLVVVYTRDRVLLLRRADDPSFWQSVTGSMRWDERDPRVTAVRELHEETGLDAHNLRDLKRARRYSILPQWRARYAPDVYENLEHAFALPLAQPVPIALSAEHSDYGWFDFPAALAKAWSATNRAVIETLHESSGAR